jgi:hypothetical protein
MIKKLLSLFRANATATVIVHESSDEVKIERNDDGALSAKDISTILLSKRAKAFK